MDGWVLQMAIATIATPSMAHNLHGLLIASQHSGVAARQADHLVIAMQSLQCTGC